MTTEPAAAATKERNRGVVRVILEHDPSLITWLSEQFGAVITRFNQLETRMGKLEDYVKDIKAAQDETAARVDAIKQDVTALLAAHDTLPTDTGELSPAVEDALKTIRDRAQAILGNAKAVDDMVPPKAPAETPPATDAPVASSDLPAANPASGL